MSRFCEKKNIGAEDSVLGFELEALGSLIETIILTWETNLAIVYAQTPQKILLVTKFMWKGRKS